MHRCRFENRNDACIYVVPICCIKNEVIFCVFLVLVLVDPWLKTGVGKLLQ